MLVPRLGPLAFRLVTSSIDLPPRYSLCIHSHVRKNNTEQQRARAFHRNFSLIKGGEGENGEITKHSLKEGGGEFLPAISWNRERLLAKPSLVARNASYKIQSQFWYPTQSAP